MKRALLFIILSILINKGISQSLNIEETINYINKINYDNRHEFVDNTRLFNSKIDKKYKGELLWNEIRIESDGRFSILSFGLIPGDNDNHKNEIEYFYISEIELINRNYFDSPNIEVDCKDGDCIGCGYKSFCHSKPLPIPEELSKYDKNKLINAYVYFFELIKENGTYNGTLHGNDKDPFAPQNITKNRINNVIRTDRENKNIPLSKEGGVYSITVKIGSIVKKFIFDSGASEVNISEELEKQLIDEGIITKDDYLPKGLYKTANGTIQECRRVNIKSISVGPFTVSNVSASISSNDAPILLGKSFLDRFKKWSIDNDKSELDLEN